MKNGTLEERGRDLARRLKRAKNQDLVNELVDEVEKLKTPHYRVRSAAVRDAAKKSTTQIFKPALGALTNFVVNGISASAARECSLTEWNKRRPANMSADAWVFEYLKANGERDFTYTAHDSKVTGALTLSNAQYDTLRAEADRNSGTVTADVHKSTRSGWVAGIPFVVKPRPERRSDRQRRQGRVNERRSNWREMGGRRVQFRRTGNERRNGYTILDRGPAMTVIRDSLAKAYSKPFPITPYRQFSFLSTPLHSPHWASGFDLSRDLGIPLKAGAYGGILRRYGASDRRDPDLFPTLGRRVLERRRRVEAFGGRRNGGNRRTSFPTARVRRKGAADRRQG